MVNITLGHINRTNLTSDTCIKSNIAIRNVQFHQVYVYMYAYVYMICTYAVTGRITFALTSINCQLAKLSSLQNQ